MPGFYASHFPSESKPLIVVRDQHVLDANPLALSKSVVRGMPLRQAKALADGCEVRSWKQEDYADRQMAWLDVCTDYTGTIEPIDQHIAALDLSSHPKPLDIAEKLIRHLAPKPPVSLRYGAAKSKWIAKLASDHHDMGRALEEPAKFLAPLAIMNLLPIQLTHRERLLFLGYPTIGDVAKVPLQVLQNQFGQEGITIKSAANGGYLDLVNPLYPRDSFKESLIFDGPADNLQTIDHALVSLARRLGQRLQQNGVQSSKLTLQFETEDQKKTNLSRTFTKPILNTKSALNSLRLLTQDAFGEHVASLRVSITDLQAVSHRQSALFDADCFDRPKATAAVQYVRRVFGEESIRLASQVEIARRVKVLKEWQHATGWR